MGEFIQYSKKMPVKIETDVFIAGGGPAGISAAIAARETGADVFLAEASQSFGGAATAMLVPTFMEFGNRKEFLAEGIGRRVYEYLSAHSPEDAKRHFPPSISVETLKLCYDEMMEASGADFVFDTRIIDVVVENGEVQYAVCADKSSCYAVKAKMYIDCTGDGDLCCFAGAEYEQGGPSGEVMGSTLCALWNGIKWDEVVSPDNRMLEQAFADHIFSQNDLLLPGMWPICGETGGSNAGHIFGVDGTDSRSVTRGVLYARKQLQEYREYYRRYLSGYEDAELVISAAQLGIRESRRISCDYRLVLGDFVSRAVFADEIGRYCYNIDIHATTADPEDYEVFAKDHAAYRYQKGESYGIPYRSLAVRNLSNVLVAGRCISSDRYMQSSVRVMPGCFITGQAAGAAAAVCVREGTDTHHVCVPHVQKALVELGAYLPNYQEQ